MWNNEDASVLVSRTLDHLGYGLPMVRFRQKYYATWSLSTPMCYTFLAGSKAEGLTKLFESDTDSLCVPKCIICTTNPHDVVCSMEYTSVFKMDMTDVAPGYTKLIHVWTGNGVPRELLKPLTEPILGKVYMQSVAWREEFRSVPLDIEGLTINPQSQGPSIPFNWRTLGDADKVFAFKCDCPILLQSWIDRQRNNSWPNEDVIREISIMEAHVVPVGYKGSPLHFLEWRICFTKAEIKLIQSFNDCQIKLLILLKWLAKSCLKTTCKEVTTYVMKNLVMWMAEKLPERYFTEQSLINTLQISLRTLKHCLLRKCLPSYMIPERNLFADRIEDYEIAILCLRIDSLLNEGPRIVIKCDKIKNSFSVLLGTPETFFLITQRILKVNILVMLIMFVRSLGWEQYTEILMNVLPLYLMPDLFTEDADTILNRFLS